MTTGTLISQLEALCRRINVMRDKVQATEMRLTKSKLKTIQSLGSKITQATTDLSETIQSMESTREKPPTDDAIKLLGQAKQCEAEKKPNVTILKRNLILIFEGPKFSVLDSNQIKARKRVLRDRCSTLRGLYPHAIVRWARNFPPSVWTTGTMSEPTFDYLVEALNSEDECTLPTGIYAILQALGDEDPLMQSCEYRSFVEGE